MMENLWNLFQCCGYISHFVVSTVVFKILPYYIILYYIIGNTVFLIKIFPNIPHTEWPVDYVHVCSLNKTKCPAVNPVFVKCMKFHCQRGVELSVMVFGDWCRIPNKLTQSRLFAVLKLQEEDRELVLCKLWKRQQKMQSFLKNHRGSHQKQGKATVTEAVWDNAFQHWCLTT